METEKSVLGLKKGTLIHERYEIRDLLGKGGFAAVFRAHDINIERDVAIKVLNLFALVSQGNDLDVMLARFKREAKLAAKISHPSVVEIYDYGVLADSDNPFIIMEVLDGHDLARQIKLDGPLDPEKFLPLFADCLEALGEAHQLDIIHKDLKPSNLFLSDPTGRRPTLKLVDFGIAHLGDVEDSRLTATGFMLGTPQYMAPEYVEEQLVSPALDVYQMGLILVELLAGQAVVQGETPWKSTLMHVSRQLSVPKALLESPLGPVIDKALALDPRQRYADGLEFAEALSAIDPAEIPKLEPDAEAQMLSADSGVVSAPKSDTRKLIEEAQRAREEASLSAELRTVETRANREEMMTPAINPSSRGVSSDAGIDTTAAKAGMQPGLGQAEPEDSDNRRWMVLALIVLLIGVAGVVWWSGQSGDDDLGGDQQRVGSAAAEQEQQALQGEGQQQGPQEEAMAEQDEPPQPFENGDVKVAVTAEPAEATIAIDGREVGQGTADVDFGQLRTDMVELVVSHDDYQTHQSVLTIDDGPEFAVALEREDDEGSAPQAESEPEPEPEPAPRPEPTPAPEPAPEPAPQPEPEPAEEEAPAEEEEDDEFLFMP